MPIRCRVGHYASLLTLSDSDTNRANSANNGKSANRANNANGGKLIPTRTNLGVGGREGRKVGVIVSVDRIGIVDNNLGR